MRCEEKRDRMTIIKGFSCGYDIRFHFMYLFCITQIRSELEVQLRDSISISNKSKEFYVILPEIPTNDVLFYQDHFALHPLSLIRRFLLHN